MAAHIALEISTSNNSETITIVMDARIGRMLFNVARVLLVSYTAQAKILASSALVEWMSETIPCSQILDL